MDELSEQVFALRKKNDKEFGEFYYPASIYGKILNEAVVRRELALTEGGTSDDELVRFVLNKAPKVFLITVETFAEIIRQDPNKICGYIRKFSANNFTDNSLPVDDDFCSSSELFAEWRLVTRDKFQRSQWHHLAPVFSENSFMFNLEPFQPLPLCKLSEKEEEGHSAIVLRVTIHPDHLLNPPQDHRGNRRDIAVKAIRPTGDAFDQFQTQFDNEASILKNMRDLKHEHIIQWLAAFRRGSKNYYLMFPWADGGNLRDFWKAVDPLKFDLDGMRNLTREALNQFRGLADAFVRLHITKGFRHGDVKPENILRFTDEKTTTGTLQIADFGLAKQHNSPTVRRGPTTTRHTTLQYESPEAEEAMMSDTALSRLSDIWSFGCVMLEYLIWLFYGYDNGVEQFNKQLKGSSGYSGSPHNTVPFYQRGSSGEATLRPIVRRWIHHMRSESDLTDTVIGSLMKLVEDNLLVPAARDENWQQSGPKPPRDGLRASAEELLQSLNSIARTTGHESGLFKDNSNLWLSNGRRTTPQTPSRRVVIPSPREPESISTARDHLTPFAANLRNPGGSKFGDAGESRISINQPVPEKMNKRWEYAIDDKMTSLLDPRVMYPASLPKPTNLCNYCVKLDFGDLDFHILYQVPSMRQPVPFCGLCKILWKVVCNKYGGESQATSHFGPNETIKFESVSSMLRIQDDNKPVLSIIASPDLTPKFNRLQLGFPKLPDPGSSTHFEIIRQWLSSCDKSHPSCNSRHPFNAPALPTRLLDVGDPTSSKVYLIETGHACIPSSSAPDSSPYIALSHPWGPPPHFCTYPDHSPHPNTLSAHIRDGIQISALPQTFQDAVITTRALGKRYLWIDSLCILQGPAGDFKDEAGKMETVFSEAYVVIAASWARAQGDGFLHATPGGTRDREVVTVSQRDGGASVYVCEMIDKFEKDVLGGSLNTRARVLQERALARRTVYFTGGQTYWECGRGVRCETGTVMTNQLASYLADPSFPAVVLSGKRGEQIKWYQDLYAQYSRLDISHDHDRPIAIRGLESRLITAFANKYKSFTGGYGVLSDGPREGLLHRSLLWRHGEMATTTGPGKGYYSPSALKPIVFPSDYNGVPPSWSWMAYSGGIDYIQIPGGTVQWEKLELSHRNTVVQGFGGGPVINVPTEDHQNNATVVVAQAWDFDPLALPRKRAAPEDDILSGNGDSGQVFYDRPGMNGTDLKCVVVGVGKAETDASQDRRDRMHFVLIVAPEPPATTLQNVYCTSTGQSQDLKMFRRVGAGSMIGRCIIGLEEGGEPVAVV